MVLGTENYEELFHSVPWVLYWQTLKQHFQVSYIQSVPGTSFSGIGVFPGVDSPSACIGPFPVDMCPVPWKGLATLPSYFLASFYILGTAKEKEELM